MKILFPTDFSDAADHAFIYALKLADKIGGEIATVHVYDLPNIRAAHLPNTLRSIYDSVTLESFDNYKDHIPHLREMAKANNMEHVNVSHSLIQSSKQGTVYSIIKAAESVEADFIIMGTTGASGLKEVFLGSVAAEVLENAKIPVLAVPFQAEFDGQLDRISFATEYHEEDAATLKSTIEFAKWFEADVYCVHVDTAHTEEYAKGMDEFKRQFESNENLNWHVVDHISIEEGLTEYIESNDIDIMAMRVKRRNLLEELFTYSIAKKMANHQRIPVLGLHA